MDSASIIGCIYALLPIQPNTAIKNNKKVKRPAKSINPISEDIPKKSFLMMDLTML